jgi:hypothetical protein
LTLLLLAAAAVQAVPAVKVTMAAGQGLAQAIVVRHWRLVAGPIQGQAASWQWAVLASIRALPPNQLLRAKNRSRVLLAVPPLPLLLLLQQLLLLLLKPQTQVPFRGFRERQHEMVLI